MGKDRPLVLAPGEGLTPAQRRAWELRNEEQRLDQIQQQWDWQNNPNNMFAQLVQGSNSPNNQGLAGGIMDQFWRVNSANQQASLFNNHLANQRYMADTYAGIFGDIAGNGGGQSGGASQFNGPDGQAIGGGNVQTAMSPTPNVQPMADAAQYNFNAVGERGGLSGQMAGKANLGQQSAITQGYNSNLLAGDKQREAARHSGNVLLNNRRGLDKQRQGFAYSQVPSNLFG